MNKVALPPCQPLPDAQAWQGAMSDVGLDWVGMQGIALPLELAGKPLMARVNVGINLRANQQGSRGIHMSRLYLALDELTQGELTPQRIADQLRAFLASQPENSDRANLSISGELLLSRPALLSPHRGWKAYPLKIDATLTTLMTLSLTVGVPYSSTCPSSAALSRQLAQQQFQFDFEQAPDAVDQQQVIDWLGEQGMPATPHSQRSWAWVTITLNDGETVLPVINLIDRIEHALGTPLQTLVKRRDEQAFALANGQNLMFCEDAARRLYRTLRSQCSHRAFSLRVEHQESLHAHNAVAELSWGEHQDAT
ncbi:GTP cyclohydrolase FolE2 [Serratia grimesii]|jgi:GTP cyclohydrolase IB|uniref:GTP cyclohydrolase FolE2 n=1 Tax=Serratia grimesii TaxID=82995 RepID=UPI00223FF9E9|nr:GTP cyclohydrolase FolE2 [Serratia grimesii]